MPIPEELLDILACPKCKQSVVLDESQESVVCGACRLRYPVRNDIPMMLIDEADPL